LMTNLELYRLHVENFRCWLCSRRLFWTLKLCHCLENICASHLCHMERLLITQTQGFPCFCHHRIDLNLLKKKFWVLKLERLINHQVFLVDVWELLLAVL
jgi:capsule polysaccharide modification protein KpsS